MSNTFFFLLTFVAISNTVLIALCVSSKNVFKGRHFPFWVSSGFIGLIILLAHILIGFYSPVSASNAEPFINHIAFFYIHLLSESLNSLQIYSTYMIIYFLMGAIAGGVLESLLKNTPYLPFKVMRIYIIMLGIIPLTNYFAIVGETYGLLNFKLFAYSVLPGILLRWFDLLMMIKTDYLFDVAVLDNYLAVLIENIFFVILLTALMRLSKRSQWYVLIISIVIILDALASLMLVKADHISFVMRNTGYLVFFTCVFFYFSHPRVRYVFAYKRLPE